VAVPARPFFSVLITAYNRADQIERSVGSASAQTFEDFEIVVVDDASTDDTVRLLERVADPRLRIVRHERNRGTSPARATAVDHGQGEWFVMLDSDDELVSDALTQLRALIDDVPPGVNVIRFRHRYDDGSVAPGILPSGVTDYAGRLEWLEAVTTAATSSDAGHCIHRSVFERMNYFRDRRGAVEALWELDLARLERSFWADEVLGLVHGDAVNGYSRDASARQIIGRLLRDAPDQLWMTETTLARHGLDLARAAPHFYEWVAEFAAVAAFLAGARRKGIRHTRTALRAGGPPARLWPVLALGTVGARTLAAANVARRRWQLRRPG
jgi:succinoglycan biosynthesis protein ExoO